MSTRCVRHSKNKRYPSGHEVRNWISLCAPANRYARFSIKHQTPATISFLSARDGLEQAGITGGGEQNTKRLKLFSRPWWGPSGDEKKGNAFSFLQGGENIFRGRRDFQVRLRSHRARLSGLW